MNSTILKNRLYFKKVTAVVFMHPDVEHVSLKDFKQLAENRLDT